MQTKPHPNHLIRLPLIAAIICCTPLLAFASEKERRGERSEGYERGSPREQTARLERRSQLATGRRSISKDYIRQRLDWLRVKDPLHSRMHAYFETLIAAGYDPLLLDAWLDSLYDGVVVVGMPGDLVLSYFGEPVYRRAIVFGGAPAFEWGIRLLPGRTERVTVSGGRVVRVRG